GPPPPPRPRETSPRRAGGRERPPGIPCLRRTLPPLLSPLRAEAPSPQGEITVPARAGTGGPAPRQGPSGGSG
ncbi:unnamed protein product, partial [Bubo scandiacus]